MSVSIVVADRVLQLFLFGISTSSLFHSLFKNFVVLSVWMRDVKSQ